MCAEVCQLRGARLAGHRPAPVLQRDAVAQGVQVEVRVGVGSPAQTAAVGMTQRAAAPLGRAGDVEQVSAQRPAEILREAGTLLLLGNERLTLDIFDVAHMVGWYWYAIVSRSLTLLLA